MKKGAKIFVSHHTALIGSAIVRKLNEKGFENLVFFPLDERELVNQKKVFSFFEQENQTVSFLLQRLAGEYWQISCSQQMCSTRQSKQR